MYVFLCITDMTQTAGTVAERLFMKSLLEPKYSSHSIGFRIGEASLCPCPICSLALGTELWKVIRLRIQRQNHVSSYDGTVGYFEFYTFCEYLCTDG